ncbi:MAG: MerR family transcriptional regulator [Planctomycetota bacterium]
MMITTTLLASLTGASKRQLGYWRKAGLSKASAKSTGHRLYTIPDAVAARTVAALRKQGCSLQKIRKAVEHLRKHYPTDVRQDVLSALTLVTDGDAVYLASNADELMDVLTKQTVFWVVHVGKLILDTQRRALALPLEWTQPVKVGGAAYRLRVSHDPDDGGFTVQCLELPGAIEQGETVEEAVTNGKAAIESVLTYLARRNGKHASKRTGRRAKSA